MSLLQQLLSDRVTPIPETVLWMHEPRRYEDGEVEIAEAHNTVLTLLSILESESLTSDFAKGNQIATLLRAGTPVVDAPDHPGPEDPQPVTERAMRSIATHVPSRGRALQLLAPAFLWSRGRLLAQWDEDVRLRDVRLGHDLLGRENLRPLKLAELDGSPDAERVLNKFHVSPGDDTFTLGYADARIGMTATGVTLLIDGAPILWDGYDGAYAFQVASPYGDSAPSPRALGRRLMDELTAQDDHRLLALLVTLITGIQVTPHPEYVLDTSWCVGTLPSPEWSPWRLHNGDAMAFSYSDV